MMSKGKISTTFKISTGESNVDGNSGKDKPWHLLEFGVPGTLQYRVQFQNNQQKDLSPWHHIPLFGQDGSFNFVCKTPKGGRNILEVAEGEKGNPLRHPVLCLGGETKPAAYRVPAKWNIGMLPQTWADPHCLNLDYEGLVYDGRPLEMIDVGEGIVQVGEVYAVKAITAFALVDGRSRLSWKLIGIATSDPRAASINNATQIARHMAGTLEAVREWLRVSTMSGDGEEPCFGFNQRVAGPDRLASEMARAHANWQLYREHVEQVDLWQPEPLPSKSPSAGQENGPHVAKKWGEMAGRTSPMRRMMQPVSDSSKLLGFLRPKDRSEALQVPQIVSSSKGLRRVRSMEPTHIGVIPPPGVTRETQTFSSRGPNSSSFRETRWHSMPNYGELAASSTEQQEQPQQRHQEAVTDTGLSSTSPAQQSIHPVFEKLHCHPDEAVADDLQQTADEPSPGSASSRTSANLMSPRTENEGHEGDTEPENNGEAESPLNSPGPSPQFSSSSPGHTRFQSPSRLPTPRKALDQVPPERNLQLHPSSPATQEGIWSPSQTPPRGFKAACRERRPTDERDSATEMKGSIDQHVQDEGTSTRGSHSSQEQTSPRTLVDQPETSNSGGRQEESSAARKDALKEQVQEKGNDIPQTYFISLSRKEAGMRSESRRLSQAAARNRSPLREALAIAAASKEEGSGRGDSSDSSEFFDIGTESPKSVLWLPSQHAGRKIPDDIAEQSSAALLGKVEEGKVNLVRKEGEAVEKVGQRDPVTAGGEQPGARIRATRPRVQSAMGTEKSSVRQSGTKVRKVRFNETVQIVTFLMESSPSSRPAPSGNERNKSPHSKWFTRQGGEEVPSSPNENANSEGPEPIVEGRASPKGDDDRSKLVNRAGSLRPQSPGGDGSETLRAANDNNSREVVPSRFQIREVLGNEAAKAPLLSLTTLEVVASQGLPVVGEHTLPGGRIPGKVSSGRTREHIPKVYPKDTFPRGANGIADSGEEGLRGRAHGGQRVTVTLPPHLAQALLAKGGMQAGQQLHQGKNQHPSITEPIRSPWLKPAGTIQEHSRSNGSRIVTIKAGPAAIKLKDDTILAKGVV